LTSGINIQKPPGTSTMNLALQVTTVGSFAPITWFETAFWIWKLCTRDQMLLLRQVNFWSTSRIILC